MSVECVWVAERASGPKWPLSAASGARPPLHTMDALLPHAVGVMQKVLKTTLVKDMDIATVSTKVGAYANCMREYSEVIAVKAALIPKSARSEADNVLETIYRFLPRSDASLRPQQLLWYVWCRYLTVHEASIEADDAWRRIRGIIEKKMFVEFPLVLQNTLAALWGYAICGPLDMDMRQNIDTLLTACVTYNNAIARWRMVDGFVDCASSGSEISTELLLLQAASARARHIASQHLKQRASPLLQGVIVSEVIMEAEVQFAEALVPVVASAELPTALPSAVEKGADLVWTSLCLARPMAGAVLPSGFSGAAADWHTYYLNVFAAFSITPRLTSASTAVARPHPQPPRPEWAKGLWEAQESGQLALVLELLGKETFAVPPHVWSPFSSYEDAPEPQDLKARSVLASKFGGQAHHLLHELREDCESAMERRQVGDDFCGQWAAARGVITCIRTIASTLMSAIANHFHNKVEKFGHADVSMLPFILLVSDVFAVSLIHFADPVLAVMVPTPPEPPKPRKLNPKVLSAVAGSGESRDGLSAQLTKIAVLIGVALDKLRGDIDRMVLRAFQHYGDNEASVAHLAALQEQGMGLLDDTEEAEGKWSHSFSPGMHHILNSLLHPVGCVCKHVASELSLHILTHAVEAVVEAAVSRAAAVLLPGVGGWEVHGNRGGAWPADPPAAVQHLPMVQTLCSDLRHLQEYLELHLDDFNLMQIPCWAYPGALFAELAR